VKFTPLGIPGAWLIEPERHADERGSFARTFCAREFAAQGLPIAFVQTSLSTNRRRGTLRGLHWQAAPHAEAKLVRCGRGRVYDVIVDLRPDSHIFRQHLGLELSAVEGNAIFVPAGVAHGFLTLEDASDVDYAMTAFHAPEAARGVRFDDPAFGIVWPEPIEVISARDRGWPDFRP